MPSKTAYLPVWGFVAALTATACGGDGADDDEVDPYEQACENASACAEAAGGAPSLEQCLADVDEAVEVADEAGCSTEFSDYNACAVTADCDDSTGLLTGCDAEAEAYIECVLAS